MEASASTAVPALPTPEEYEGVARAVGAAQDQIERLRLRFVAIERAYVERAGLPDRLPTLEDVNEPYLIMQGYLKRTPQGRVAMPATFRKLGVVEPKREGELFT